jgi:uncharacterized protein
MTIRHLNPDGTPKYTNRLSSQTSPYLQKHAHNPVEWYPWGEEAFERARSERKPIHLSVGYLACHWCSVLEAESFEDEATARLLNDAYVNIKVDREERPDIDRIYQIAQQLLTRRAGGWPLTMFLTHDERYPFFGGTYFPREARFGLPAFQDVLQRVSQYYREHEAELRAQSATLMEAFTELNPPPAPQGTALTDAPIKMSRQQLAQTFDARFGGFGSAPKFPHPLLIERLLRDWYATVGEREPDLQALYMATLTLRRMAEGGINDQLAGGFCRYSVDAYWMIPHFEKMLYDNAGLLAVYAQAALATGDRLYAQIAAATAEWALREMRSAQGGFYSSFDADSEGHEGKYYVWDREEVRGALTASEYAVFSMRFGLDRAANFEGHWHLHAFRGVEECAAEAGLAASAAEAALQSARLKLLALRRQRVPPARDDKVLTGWNALMIRGLAIAARALERDDLAEAATRALDFIRGTLWREGRLLATSRDGRAHLNAYLDDYVYLADAILELQQVRFRADELAFARELLEVVLQHFSGESGGLYFTSDDHEALIHRSLNFADEATPAGNGIGAFVLLRMGYLLGEERLLAASEAILRAAWASLTQHPASHSSLLLALEEYLQPPEIVIVRGAEPELARWRSELAKLYAPGRLVLAIPSAVTDLPPALAAKAARPTTVGYICRGSTCSAPVESLSALAHELQPATA